MQCDAEIVGDSYFGFVIEDDTGYFISQHNDLDVEPLNNKLCHNELNM